MKFHLVSLAVLCCVFSAGCAATMPPPPPVNPCYAEVSNFVGKEEMAMVNLTCEELNKHGVPIAVKGWYTSHCR